MHKLGRMLGIRENDKDENGSASMEPLKAFKACVHSSFNRSQFCGRSPRIRTRAPFSETRSCNYSKSRPSKRERDYNLVVVSSESHLYLVMLNKVEGSLKVVDKFELVLGKGRGTFGRLHRTEYLRYVPKMDILIVGNGSLSRVAILQIVSEGSGKCRFRLNGYYPSANYCEENHLGPLMGLSIAEDSQGFRAFLLNHLHVDERPAPCALTVVRIAQSPIKVGRGKEDPRLPFLDVLL